MFTSTLRGMGSSGLLTPDNICEYPWLECLLVKLENDRQTLRLMWRRESPLSKIFLLPQNTPGYLLRLEFGLTSLSVKLMEYVWNWIICILKMAPDRWPRLCLLRLIKLSTNPSKDPKYNWVAKFELILKLCNLECMFGNLQPNFWMEKKKLYAEYLKNNDFNRYFCSTCPQSQLIRTRSDDVPWYVQTRCPIRQKRVIAQLRLANIHR
ncbi:hypothetical protein KQX54_002925 [Cotesia glomerata]|uniref:Uncharacterized protein n=1 Tax=Cotesia glomerata TaxID=32391 RepID=A0AAV7HZM3_COTGL|nr:hypothetical protein KQX54_002925 [Cotesia glomerata]